jgi:hypothetical protein
MAVPGIGGGAPNLLRDAINGLPEGGLAARVEPGLVVARFIVEESGTPEAMSATVQQIAALATLGATHRRNLGAGASLANGPSSWLETALLGCNTAESAISHPDLIVVLNTLQPADILSSRLPHAGAINDNKERRLAAYKEIKEASKQLGGLFAALRKTSYEVEGYKQGDTEMTDDQKLATGLFQEGAYPLFFAFALQAAEEVPGE